MASLKGKEGRGVGWNEGGRSGGVHALEKEHRTEEWKTNQGASAQEL